MHLKSTIVTALLELSILSTVYGQSIYERDGSLELDPRNYIHSRNPSGENLHHFRRRDINEDFILERRTLPAMGAQLNEGINPPKKHKVDFSKLSEGFKKFQRTTGLGGGSGSMGGSGFPGMDPPPFYKPISSTLKRRAILDDLAPRRYVVLEPKRKETQIKSRSDLFEDGLKVLEARIRTPPNQTPEQTRYNKLHGIVNRELHDDGFSTLKARVWTPSGRSHEHSRYNKLPGIVYRDVHADNIKALKARIWTPPNQSAEQTRYNKLHGIFNREAHEEDWFNGLEAREADEDVLVAREFEMEELSSREADPDAEAEAEAEADPEVWVE